MRNLTKLSKAQLEAMLQSTEEKHRDIAAGIKTFEPDAEVKAAFDRLSAELEYQASAIKAELKTR